MRIRTLFLGTSNFAIPILKTLIDQEYIDIVGVVTQPDKLAGRHHKLAQPAIKRWLLENAEAVTLFQPEKLSQTAQDILTQIDPELIIVASYGQFVPARMLDYPKYKCLNIHASLLPVLRGAVPIPMAILQGLSETGVTLQIMEQKMDVGKILATSRLPISEEDTTESLTKRLGQLGAELVLDTLLRWLEGEIESVGQDESKATYCYQSDVAKEKAEINFGLTYQEISRKVRAFYPWPVAWTQLSAMNIDKNALQGKILKIFQIRKVIEDERTQHFQVGKLVKLDKRLCVRCQDAIIELSEVQLEGKQKMRGKEYLFLV